jgi:hypothetical protein
LFSTLAAMSACLPSSEPPSGIPKSLQVRIEPDGTLEAAPPVVRIRVYVGEHRDPDDVHLVAGDVRAAHLGQFFRDEISVALSERIVPTLKWIDGEDVVLAPTRVLELGSDYHVVVGALRASQELTVAPEDPLPLLSLVWPPDGVSHGGDLAVWCGETLLPPVSMRATLHPGALTAELAGGASEAGIGRSCAHLRMPWLPESVVPPPAITVAEGSPFARLEPIALRMEAEVDAPERLRCPLGQLPLGPACVVDIADDRLRVEAPKAELLWLFTDGWHLDFVAANGGGSFLVHPLIPRTPTKLQWEVTDTSGRSESGVSRVFMQPPMAHLVITEVLANPVGPEPEQEFVELYNDGLAMADLGHFVIEDIGGTTTIPAGVVLMPGAYALIVNLGYDVDSEYDPSPANGTLVVRVDKLGKGGLKNDGEPLKLIDRRGKVVSRFPPLPKPKSGLSVHRIAPRVASDDTEGFARAEPTPGLPYVESVE